MDEEKEGEWRSGWRCGGGIFRYQGGGVGERCGGVGEKGIAVAVAAVSPCSAGFGYREDEGKWTRHTVDSPSVGREDG